MTIPSAVAIGAAMLVAMAPPKNSPTKGQPAPGAKPSLAEVGREAQRKALLAELKLQNWNLTATARELGLTGPSNVIRAMKNLGLADEYEAAKARGDISPGRPT